jgi:hypothetical protein
MADRVAVSACLLSWKRPRNLQSIVPALHNLEFIDEILIWNNNPSVRLEFPGMRVRVLCSQANVSSYGRYLCANHARNPVIYTQDDDVRVSNIPDLYASFLSDRTRIAHALRPRQYAARNRELHGNCQVALLGWGALFMKEWTSVLDEVPENLRCGRLFQREADRFFTVLMARRHNAMPARVRRLKDHATEGIALWREPDHWVCKGLAVREALRMVRQRSSPAPPCPWHIVITCRRDRRSLRDTARSVLCSDADYELSIVDDVSNGEIPNVVEELRELCPSLRFVRNPDSDGVAASHNRAIRAVDSSFVVLLDAGDTLGADYLHDAGLLLEQGADVVNPSATISADRDMLFRRNTVHRCAAFRRSFWTRVGGFDETAPGWGDHDFRIRAAAAGARIEALRGNHVFCRQGRQGEIKLPEYPRNKYESLDP